MIPLTDTLDESASKRSVTAPTLIFGSRFRGPGSNRSPELAAHLSSRTYSLPKSQVRSRREVVAGAATVSQHIRSRPKPTAAFIAGGNLPTTHNCFKAFEIALDFLFRS